MTDRTFTILSYVVGVPVVLAAMGAVMLFGLYWVNLILTA